MKRCKIGKNYILHFGNTIQNRGKLISQLHLIATQSKKKRRESRTPTLVNRRLDQNFQVSTNMLVILWSVCIHVQYCTYHCHVCTVQCTYLQNMNISLRVWLCVTFQLNQVQFRCNLKYTQQIRGIVSDSVHVSLLRQTKCSIHQVKSRQIVPLCGTAGVLGFSIGLLVNY